MSSGLDVNSWFNLIGWGLMIIIFAVMAFRETESQQAPDDNDMAWPNIGYPEMDLKFKRVDNLEKKAKRMKKQKSNRIPILIIMGLFGAVALALKVMAKALHMTYNEINIIVYYLIIPLTWCLMLDYIYKLPILTTLWVILWIYIFWSKRKFFRKWCDVAFQLSVDFLLKFQRIGWNYWEASVIIGVVVPILVYFVLILMLVKA